MNSEKYVLLLLDGEEPSKKIIEQFSRDAALIIATDGAAKYAYEHGISLNVIIGDMDSASEELLKIYQDRDARIVKNQDQYSNDFEKALRFIHSELLLKNIIVLGIHGKRTDHLLTNFSVMLRYADHFDSLTAFDTTHRHHFLTEKKCSYSFDFATGSVISLTPLPQAYGVKTTGLFYAIHNKDMIFGENEGLSNIISEEHASVEIIKGALLISIPFTL